MKTDRVKVLNQIDDIDARSQGAKIEMALIYGKGIPLGSLWMRRTLYRSFNYGKTCNIVIYVLYTNKITQLLIPLRRYKCGQDKQNLTAL